MSESRPGRKSVTQKENLGINGSTTAQVSTQSSYRIATPPSNVSPKTTISNPFDLTSIASTLSSSHIMADTSASSAIRIRNIAPHTTLEKLQDVLEFIDRDFERVDLMRGDGTESTQTAIARFKTPMAAQKAQAALDGRQLNGRRAGEPEVVVELVSSSPGSSKENAASAARTHSGSSTNSASAQHRGAFQHSYISPPANNVFGGYSSSSEAQYFSNPGDTRPRMSGRDVIGEDGPDEDTSDLIRDPLRYANNERHEALSRRSTTSNGPPMTGYFNNVNPISTKPSSQPSSGITTPRHSGPHSATGMMPPSNSINGPPYQMRQSTFNRATMPPVNPADQNPPCNTLYVGNLPIDTSEDELKAMFSKQRGYKRLCFRTKQNGPMCFVEFEDVSFATKALNDLYGYPLHNSAHRGGIRLSFSKNPLGVRNGQPGGAGMLGPPTPMTPSGHFPPMHNSGLGAQAFSTANGPPPGIPAPPGLPHSTGSGMTPTAMAFPSNGMSAGLMMNSTGTGYGEYQPDTTSMGSYINTGWSSIPNRQADGYGGYVGDR